MPISPFPVLLSFPNPLIFGWLFLFFLGFIVFFLLFFLALFLEFSTQNWSCTTVPMRLHVWITMEWSAFFVFHDWCFRFSTTYVTYRVLNAANSACFVGASGNPKTVRFMPCTYVCEFVCIDGHVWVFHGVCTYVWSLGSLRPSRSTSLLNSFSLLCTFSYPN